MRSALSRTRARSATARSASLLPDDIGQAGEPADRGVRQSDFDAGGERILGVAPARRQDPIAAVPEVLETGRLHYPPDGADRIERRMLVGEPLERTVPIRQHDHGAPP